MTERNIGGESKNRNKLAAAVLVGSLAVGLLAGCGESGPDMQHRQEVANRRVDRLVAATEKIIKSPLFADSNQEWTTVYDSKPVFPQHSPVPIWKDGKDHFSLAYKVLANGSTEVMFTEWDKGGGQPSWYGTELNFNAGPTTSETSRPVFSWDDSWGDSTAYTKDMGMAKFYRTAEDNTDNKVLKSGELNKELREAERIVSGFDVQD